MAAQGESDGLILEIGPRLAGHLTSRLTSPLGHKRSFQNLIGMSPPGGRPDVIRAKADIETAPRSRADPSANARLRQRNA